ncbi:MAG: hypothetical protein V3T17_04525 [Pseudomonadales bacterium]
MAFLNGVQMVIKDGHVGIGTNAPDYPLHVANSVDRSFTAYGYLDPTGVTAAVSTRIGPFLRNLS